MVRIFENIDCEKALKDYPNNYFDLAIVDPPYGIKTHKFGMGRRKGAKLKYKMKPFDNKRPDPSYFNELLRVSKNQIIWGGNYYADLLPASRCWIIWDKQQPEGVSFAKGELAWTSFDRVVEKFTFRYTGCFGKKASSYKRIHPNQKPIELYEWILKNFAKDGNKILDTHVGSGSSLIACENLNFDYHGFEIDGDYYEEALLRIKEARQKLKLAI